jgi:hypothetical protein
MKFMQNPNVPYFGHSWSSDCRGLNNVPMETRPLFLICLYFTVLVDQAMYTYFQSHYHRFASLTQYPKFCHGLGQFQKNPRDILKIPVLKRMVDEIEIEKNLSVGMELFVEEVNDFLQNYMPYIDSADFFEKLTLDPDVQIPTIILKLNPEMKNDIDVKAYMSLRAAVRKFC